jgi:hypothetical protein
MEMFKSMETDTETANQIAEQQKIIQMAEQKKNKLLELITTGAITTASFRSMTATCDREVEQAQKTIDVLEEELFSKEEARKHMSEIRSRLDAAVRDASEGMITPKFVTQYIDRILVTPGENDRTNLEIRVFTGKSTQKWLEKVRFQHQSRTGHTSKKMIQSYENGLAGKNQNQ